MKQTTFGLSVFLLIVFSSIVFAQDFGAGIEILTTGPPVITIDVVNYSGIAEGPLSISFNVSDLQNVSNCTFYYDGDLNATTNQPPENTEISYSISNVTFGVHNWTIQCTDNASETGVIGPVFVVAHYFSNSTLLNDINLSLVDNRNVNGLAFYNSYGGVNYSNSVDISSGINFRDNIAISDNSISLNLSGGMSIPANVTLILTGLSFSNPEPLLDGAECSSSICTEVSYFGSEFVFTALSYGNFSSQETPASSSGGSSGGGGGGGSSGGGGGAVVGKFPGEYVAELIEVVPYENGDYLIRIQITNKETRMITVQIDSSKIEGDLADELPKAIRLKREESKVLEFKIKKKTGDSKIFLESGEFFQVIDLSLERVSERKFVFSAIINGSKEFFPDETIPFFMYVFNPNETSFGLFEFTIKNEFGHQLHYETHTAELQPGDNSVKHYVPLPKKIPGGSYIVTVSAKVHNLKSFDQMQFFVVDDKILFQQVLEANQELLWWLPVEIAVLFGIFLLARMLINRKREKKVENREIKEGETNDALPKEGK